MNLYFSYLIFQSNSIRNKVIYWKDGNNSKIIESKDKFLGLALSMAPTLYPQIYDACNTYSFYLWDNIDNKIIHLTQKIQKEEQRKHKDSLITEFLKLKNNKYYTTPIGKEKNNKQKDSLFMVLENLGFESPSFEVIPELLNSFDSSDKSFVKNIKSLFKK